MNPLQTRALTPPRPNLGPEPWPDREPALGFWIVVAAVATLGVAWLWFRRHRQSPLASLIASAGHADEKSPAESLLELAMAVRRALASRLGPAWRARTTEEIARDPALREALGDLVLDQLVRFLDQVDTLKFAVGGPSSDDERLAADLARWSDWAAALERSLKSTANARSKPTTARVSSVRQAGHSAGGGRRTT